MIAAGTRPYHPPDVPFNGINVFDSDEIVDIPRLPRSLTVVVGGVMQAIPGQKVDPVPATVAAAK